ncbi:MAG: arsenate reductase (glutaredoxin) [Deltaproteobacteria bacterium]|nr:arsenate reductase (glutaredoxin) [Deltaproteobacteria bacterium]
MEQPTIYHNPRCSKSRQTLALLEQHGFAPLVVRYLDAPPSAEALERLLDALDQPPLALVRRKEKEFADAGLSERSSSRAVAEAIQRWPILMERPLVYFRGRAAIGRPPEKVLALFE